MVELLTTIETTIRKQRQITWFLWLTLLRWNLVLITILLLLPEVHGLIFPPTELFDSSSAAAKTARASPPPTTTTTKWGECVSFPSCSTSNLCLQVPNRKQRSSDWTLWAFQRSSKPKRNNGGNEQRRRRLRPPRSGYKQHPALLKVPSEKSQRSIEDLESELKQRFEKMEPSPVTSTDSTKSSSPTNRNRSSQRRPRRRRRVVDPWMFNDKVEEEDDDDDDDDDDHNDEDVEMRANEDSNAEEFDEYDSDPEEIQKSNNKQNNIHSKNKSRRQDATTRSSSSSSSTPFYFFHPPKPEPVPSAKMSTNHHPKDNESSTNNSKPAKKRRKRILSTNDALPLLNEKTGQPMVLTTDEAVRRFQETMTGDTSRSDHGDMDSHLTTTPSVAGNSTIDDDTDVDNGNNDSMPVTTFNDIVPIVQFSQSRATWESLGITHPILRNNIESQKKLNCPKPLSVQEKAIPSILNQQQDVIIGTYTGSGKTLAFLTPLIQRLLSRTEMDTARETPKSLVMDNVTDISANTSSTTSRQRSSKDLAIVIVAPGRELASQIVQVARSLIQGTDLNAQLAIGGTTFSKNLAHLRKQKPNILVGTPGRIAELIVGKPGEKSGRLKIGSIESLVLDEFDALLQYEVHSAPTQAILLALKQRHRDRLQSVLCSATATDMMESDNQNGEQKLLQQNLLRPGFVTALADDDDVLVVEKAKSTRATDGGQNDNPQWSSAQQRPQVSRTVLHGVVHVPQRRLILETIRRILHTEPMPEQVVIFVDTARKVDMVVKELGDRGIVAAPFHGGMGSEKLDRAQVSRALRDGNVGLVVATELAARGLDAPFLTHVINMDLPTDASHYAHRAGRCGRGGRPGVVINLTTSPKARKVPFQFAATLGIDMHTVEPREGKLVILDPTTLHSGTIKSNH